ncbi:ABC transporter ATP-binding protein [Asanoa ishikariensis]|uniref:Amino acid/amide ABC transporter ATP-binding protein 2, HAAT family n=1 Tax=Asanoa ishikariensis TaxID=137265 RepID=A0A1H3TNV8_9ACTN|nr:ABC transporter ATP-binding protein [Asanoa ishikariensis]GIF62060.1 ABC transporter ATP-binding protein [Asanoa ishikariensis]SDZ51924.1 amino acid/amide ABC transporter ATP-binding protein 2, HAAT family [Asanoa ishikariensis]
MLEVRGLDARYGDAQALWDVALDVGAAETVCIVGPNGAGKTTLVQTIAGLHRAAAGTITVEGVDVAALPGHRVCDHGVATVPEGRRVFGHMSVRDNLLLGAYRRPARAVHRETEARVYELFPRLKERATQQAGSLSGGEQQMLALGRALMALPRLLLLDEPSLGLAPVIVDEVFDAIAAVNATGVSVLLVEQDVERALSAASRGYLLIEGRIVASGTTTELRESADVRERVLGM